MTQKVSPHISLQSLSTDMLDRGAGLGPLGTAPRPELASPWGAMSPSRVSPGRVEGAPVSSGANQSNTGFSGAPSHMFLFETCPMAMTAPHPYPFTRLHNSMFTAGGLLVSCGRDLLGKLERPLSSSSPPLSPPP